MKITDLLLGKALPTWMERAERVGIATGVAIFGLDALSSAAYGPEAALTMLIPLRRLSVFYIVPISASIIVLLKVTGLKPPVVMMPIQRWAKASAKALRFALTISQEIEAVHVEAENETPVIDQDWDNFVLAPHREQELPLPNLVILKSPYRQVISPIVDYVFRVVDQHPARQIAVVVRSCLSTTGTMICCVIIERNF